MERTVYQLEIAGATATLYLSSCVDARDLESMRRLCDDLPRTVRMLRVDLHAIAAMNDQLAGAMRTLIRHWRSSGRTGVRLSFRTSHIVATFAAEATTDLVPIAALSGPAPFRMANEAFTAAYI